jgi:asparagine synthase (glutamine-hydrolysing)
MATALAPRGPDDEGVHLDGNLGLAHRRLSILDLTSAGHQPMSNEDGSVWLVYNGQLYGFQALRDWLEGRGHRFRSRTDTEVLIHLYEEVGDAFVERVDGMFALALWDTRRRRLLLARDRLGIKPLFIQERHDGLAFASELRALRATADGPQDIDVAGVVRFLFYSAPTGGAGLLRGYRRLPPATCMAVEAGGQRSWRYWHLPVGDTGSPPPFKAAVASFRERFAEAVRSHLVADVPVGVFLSGGLDSSAVAAAVRQCSSGPLHSFSVRFTEVGAVDEGPAAAATARTLGTVHHELVVGPAVLSSLADWIRSCDEPLAIVSAVPVLELARFAREHVKVALTGDGGDEVLAGYPWRHSMGGVAPAVLARRFAMLALRGWRGARGTGPGLGAQLATRLRRMASDPAGHYASLVAGFTPEELSALLVPELGPVVKQVWDDDPVSRAYAAATTPDAVNRYLEADLASTLEGEMLTKVDRMTMAAGLEARVPFLDRGLVEWLFSLPGAYKTRGDTGKIILRSSLASVLPEVARGPKKGFSPPLGAWLRGPLRPFLADTLTPARVRERGWLRPGMVERMLSAHLTGRADLSRKLFALLVLETWLGTPPLGTSTKEA